MRRHLHILEFAVASLRRNLGKNLVVVAVYSLLVAVLASLLVFLESARLESRRLLAGSPDLIVQRIRGGRHEPTPIERAQEIRGMRGVGAVTPRVWGYTFDPPSGATLTLWGGGSVPFDALEFADPGFRGAELEEGCVVGAGLADLRFLGVGDRFPIRRFDGTLFAPRVVGIFTTQSSLLTNDLVVMPTADLRRVFGMDDHLCTDISIEIHNSNEVEVVARKIVERWPDARTITRAQILQTYDALFDWRGGVWVAVLLCCVAAFAILVWDKGTGLSAEELRTVGLLKAVGWKSREVIELKLCEGAAISLVSLLAGLLMAGLHLLVFDGFLFARVIKGWSVLFPPFSIDPVPDPLTLLLCVTFTAVPYVAASLVPSWRAAIIDPDTVLRS